VVQQLVVSAITYSHQMISGASKLVAPLQDGNRIAAPSFCALMKFYLL